jgi:anhydro-N-acetylmuramic acid kinase
MEKIPIIGLMSGTSMDGIDASFVYTDGISLERTNYSSITPYQFKTKKLLQMAIHNPVDFLNDQLNLSLLTQLITEEHADAVIGLINKFKLNPFLIGFHGQTIFHNPKTIGSIQLGSGILLGQILKKNIVYNFRNNDIKSGGQGAPLAPIYHKNLLEILNTPLPAIIVNIGGISNLTYWDGKDLLGYDTGPGNNLMDFYMKKKFNKPFDSNGIIASKGVIKFNYVKDYFKNTFFESAPPKSLDRLELFDNTTLDQLQNERPEDCMATLCYLTVKSILKAFDFLPKTPISCILVGGGQKNGFLVDLIKECLPCNIYTSEELKIPGDFIEAELIAFLAARRYNDLYTTFPSTTGASANIIGGDLVMYKKD